MTTNERPVKIERNMAQSIDHGTHIHDIRKENATSHNPLGLPTDLLTKSTDFSGEARVAQVLRWVSTVALQANANQAQEISHKKNPKWTPEDLILASSTSSKALTRPVCGR